MLREIAAGAPHLDLETLSLMKPCSLGSEEFSRRARPPARSARFTRCWRTSVVGPLLMNAARERMAAEPGRSQLPMFVPISHEDLIAHIQHTAQRMLAKELTP